MDPISTGKGNYHTFHPRVFVNLGLELQERNHPSDKTKSRQIFDQGSITTKTTHKQTSNKKQQKTWKQKMNCKLQLVLLGWNIWKQWKNAWFFRVPKKNTKRTSSEFVLPKTPSHHIVPKCLFTPMPFQGELLGASHPIWKTVPLKTACWLFIRNHHKCIV